MDEIFIPIGNDCSVAYNLSQLGKRHFALPFDWIRLNNIDRVIELLQNDFEDFLNPAYLVEKRKITGFPLLDNDWTECSTEKERPEIVNSKYNISFLHDFSNGLTDEKELSEVQEKYSRRIDRLREILKDESIKVFVRGTLKKKIPKEKQLLEECFKNMGISNVKLCFVDLNSFTVEMGTPIKDRWKRGPPELWSKYFDLQK